MERGCGECWRGTPSLGRPCEKPVGGGLHRRGRQDAQEGRYVGVITPPSRIRDRGSPRPSLPLFSSRLVANSASAPSFPPLFLSLPPTPLVHRLLVAQLPVAGAWVVVVGEGGGSY